MNDQSVVAYSDTWSTLSPMTGLVREHIALGERFCGVPSIVIAPTSERGTRAHVFSTMHSQS